MRRSSDEQNVGVAGLRKAGYHHGNLKEALVSAARVLILEKGPHGFSLIEAARLANVSPAAPYRHFKDKDALLAEVAGRGFEKFSNQLEAAWNDVAPDRLTALKRLGHAYLEFALTQKAYYAAMFQAGLSDLDNPSLKDGVDRAHGTLSMIISEIKGKDSTGRSIPAEAIFFHIRSLAHGAATLRQAGGTPVLSRHQMLDLGIELYLKGLKMLDW